MDKDEAFSNLLAAIDAFNLTIKYSRDVPVFPVALVTDLRELFTEMQRATVTYIQAKAPGSVPEPTD